MLNGNKSAHGLDTALADVLRPLIDAGMHVSVSYSPYEGGSWTAAALQVGTSVSVAAPHHPTPSAACLALVSMYHAL